jgi:hypothetical protein
VLPAAERLAEIPGVSLDLARAIIAETGLDMTRFPTAAHLASWAGLTPVARQSGPRSRKPGRGHGDSYLRGSCTQAATGAATTDTFLGERLRRLSRRLGGSRARRAAGRSILVIIWHRDHPESGCGVAGVAADAARTGGPVRGSYTRQVKECLAVLADLIGNPDGQAGEREAVLTLSVLVGAISMARAVDDPDLARQIMTNAAAALKQSILP